MVCGTGSGVGTCAALEVLPGSHFLKPTHKEISMQKKSYSIAVKRFAIKVLSMIIAGSLNIHLVSAITCPCTSQVFQSFTEYSGGAGSEGIETGDFNNDSKLDLITANSTNDVSLLLGNGAGAFGSPMFYGIGGSLPRAIIVSDFNADGNLDFATSNDTSANITVRYGDGNGGFGLINLYTVKDNVNDPARPFRLTTGDFNHDGRIDIATSNQNGTVSIFDNLGRSFAKRQPNVVMPTIGDLYSIRSADFNGDGWDDLVTTRYPLFDTQPVFIMLNDHLLGWNISRPAGYSAFESVTNSITGDFDGDGIKDDLVIGAVFQGGNSIRVFTGDANGTLALTQSLSFPGYWGGGLRAGDFNADSKLDIAAAGGYNNPSLGGGPSIAVYFAMNLGGGQFGDLTAVSLGSNHIPTDTAVGDFNGDGKPDAAFSVAISNTVAVLLNNFNLNATKKTDYDGDGRTDFAIWRPSNGQWWVSYSFFNSHNVVSFGQSGDVPVPGDYDGDKKTDFAVFRPADGNWWVLRSSDNTFTVQHWGVSGDKLTPADYDGDCKTDLAVFRPSDATWYILQSSNGAVRYAYFGLNDDIPVPGDYDGDGRADVAVFRPSDRTWYVQRSSDNAYLIQQWGLSDDKPVPGDYDGDCKTDIAVWRASDGVWYISRSSSNGSLLAYQIGGAAGDIPQPGDYDGDGKTDAALFRPTTGTWSVIKSSNSTTLTKQWGLGTDVPTASVYPVQ